MEQEQEEPQHWDKCLQLVLHLPAVLEWSLISWELKDQGTCPVTLPVLLGLFSHPQGLWLFSHPLGLWLAPCLRQRHQ